MGISTTNYEKRSTKNVKIDLPKNQVQTEEDTEMGFRKGMKKKLIKQISQNR